MKDLDLSALFCEVLSGLALAIVATLVLDWIAPSTRATILEWLANHVTLGGVAAGIAAAYLLGLVVDAIGLVLDEGLAAFIPWFGLAKAPTTAQRDAFRNKAAEHVFLYWKEQWTYYSCYRNLLFFLTLGAVPAVRAAYHYGGTCTSVVVSLLLAVLALALARSMKTLFTLYREIPASFT